MPLPSSGQISLSDIAEEKKGSGLPSGGYWQNISLRGCSVDGVNDFSFYNGDSIITADYTGTPNSSAPYGMAEFYGYSQFSWGTPGSITTNSTYPFNGYQENRNGNDTDYVSACNMTLNTSTKSISFTFTNTDGSGGFNVNIGSTNTASISYSGTLSSLEARFVYSGESITVGSAGTANDGRVVEMFNNAGHLSTSNVDNNGFSGTSAANDISSGASDTYQSLRTTSGDMSIALAVMVDNTDTNSGSGAAIAFSSSDSLKIQLRANGSQVVDLYTRTGTFSMQADSSEDGSS